MVEVETRSRARVTAYTSAVIIAVSASVFLAVVPLLPAAPVIPILVGIGLGALSMRNRGIAIATLYLLVYFSVLWQMIGFGFFQLLSAGVGVAVLLAMALPLLAFMTRRVELSSMALAALAVALMLTPAYFLSVPIIAAASLTFGGLASLEALAATFIFFLTPFLLLENALYFTTTGGATAPIIFGQFTLLSQNLRPSLPGLNVLLTGLPAGYLSHHALAVSTWLAGSAGVLLIPMVIFGVVLVAAASVGAVSRTLLERFEKQREVGGSVKLVFAPLVVAVVTPAIFIVLISLLSLPESGGFQTSFTSDPSHLQAAYMLGSSFLLTTSFIGRESLILRLEGVQVGTEGLEALIGACLAKMKDSQELLDRVSGLVPSMNMSGERRSMSEYSAYISDIQRQMGGASAALIAQFQSQLEATVLAPLEGFHDLVTRRVASEIRGLISATATANNHLEESKVTLRYPDIPPVEDASPLDALVSAYQAAVAAIKDVTKELSDLYSKETSSLEVLMGQEEVGAPVNATALLDTDEFTRSMRLVAEEYWLNFHLRWSEPVDQKKSALLDVVKGVYPAMKEGERGRLDSISKAVEAACPSNSASTLESLVDLRSVVEKTVTETSSGAQRVQSMLESLELGPVRVLRFETINRANEVAELKNGLRGLGVSFDAMTGFLRAAAGVLQSQVDAWKVDRENLVVLAQYPLARRVIERLLEGQT
ncbi:MAG: hypothetical protein JRN07_05730, partial [Nitrososphaerota archaeon]|nr:hypothetical protein [Nitrososphaerota archaeon]